MKQFALIIGLLFLLQACKKDVLNDGPPPLKQVINQGNIYNHCEPDPFFLILDTMMQYTSALPIDSMFSPNWLGYIDNAEHQMYEVYQDSTIADFKLTYLQNGVLEYEVLNPSISINPVVLDIDSMSTDEPPFYGAIKIHRGNQEILIMMVNRYIGGCLHDELVWQLSE